MARDYSERREQARELRRSGLSYSEIRKEMGGVSNSSLVKWLADITLDEVSQERLRKKKGIGDRSTEAYKAAIAKRAEANSGRREKRWQAARDQAEREWMKLSADPEFMFGLGLYVGEGDKQSNWSITISNCDPRVIRAGMRFFRLAGVEESKINPNIQLNAILEDSEKAAIDFWSEQIGITADRFKKTTIDRRKGTGKSGKNRWPNGCCHIRVNDTLLKQKILRWIELSGE